MLEMFLAYLPMVYIFLYYSFARVCSNFDDFNNRNSWLSFVVSTVSLSLSHWYPGSGVVLDCIDS